MLICFLVDSISTLFFAAYRRIYIHVTDECYEAQRKKIWQSTESSAYSA